ncbi:MAG: hypothetical protein ACRD1C_05655 [Terriglobales bacterium]
MATTTFSPTPAQRRLLDLMHEKLAVSTTLALCQAIGVPRTTFYRWCKDPAFSAWFGIAWASRLLIEGAALVNIARAQAPQKFSSWKAVFDLTFDPKGLGLLASWQAALGHLPADAFLPAPNPTGMPGPPVEHSNQQITASGGTVLAPLRPPAPPQAHVLPGQFARTVARALRPLSRQLGDTLSASGRPSPRPSQDACPPVAQQNH